MERWKAGDQPPLRKSAPKASAGAKAATKKQAGKDDPKEKEPPSEEDLKKYGPSQFKPGTNVEIFGLESWDGKQLNGQKGRVTQYLYEKIRYEVSLGLKTVSVRPVNLKETEKPDKKWTYGNTCRLVGLRETDDEALRDANGCLGTLTSRGKDSAWKVIANGKYHSVFPEFLRVCTFTEEFITLSFIGRSIQSLAVVGTLHLLFGFIFVVMKLELPKYFKLEPTEEQNAQEQSLLVMVVNPKIPSVYAASLSGVTVVWTFLVLWGTIVGCCVMHRCLRDPSTTFTQIAELSVGRKSARMLFRLGFGMVTALVFATVVLHKVLVMPHLPHLPSVADDVFFWGVAAGVGLTIQVAILVDVGYSWRTLVHRLGGALVALAAYKHLNATMALYLPGVRSEFAFLQMLRDYLPDRQLFEESEEVRASAELMKAAQEFASSSEFLRHPYVHVAILIRYHVLTYWPLTIPMLLVFPSIVERVPEKSKVSASSLLRSMFAWLQWLLVLMCSLMMLSYALDLVVASLLPVPISTSTHVVDDGDVEPWEF